MAKRSIGKVTVACTGEKKELEIKDFVQCNFPKGRFISVSCLEKKEGFVLVVENPESTGRSNQQMWLSYESFIGLITTSIIYLNHNNIDIGAEAERMKGEEIQFEYAKR